MTDLEMLNFIAYIARKFSTTKIRRVQIFVIDCYFLLKEVLRFKRSS